MEFRLLRADEIECRISTVKRNGLSLLLYKDARCDQNILDETVGAFNWQRHHSRDNANCTVSIWDDEKSQWIEKEDTGTESNTEKEKGLASDSFKRACFNWGIGRELYTAPFMWVPEDKCKIEEKAKDVFKCYDRFVVDDIRYEGRKISYVRVINTKNKKAIEFRSEVADVGNRKIAEVKAKALLELCNEVGVDVKALCERNNVTKLSDLTEYQAAMIVKAVNKARKKNGEDR